MKVRIEANKLRGKVAAPSSKSLAHRDIILAALTGGQAEIKLNNFCEDIEVTVEALKNLGFNVGKNNDSYLLKEREKIKKGKIDFKESGSSLRFILPLANYFAKEVYCSAGSYLSKRPIKELLDQLRANNFFISSDKLPFELRGEFIGGEFSFPGNITSQYISGILMAAAKVNKLTKIIVKGPLQSRPYVDLTVDELKKFGTDVQGGENFYKIRGGKLKIPETINIEGDWTNAAIFICANFMGSNIKISNLKIDSIQGDKKILEIVKAMGSKVFFENGILTNTGGYEKEMEIDISDIPDLGPVLAVILASSEKKSRLIKASRLRLKESDRVESISEMINNLGARAKISGDTLEISGRIVGGKVNSFNDHRIVMAAILASTFAKENIIIEGAEAVEKSYKKFFEDFKSLGGNFVCYR